MISLIYLLFRLTLLAAFTFLFVVLYEHGPAGFKDGVTVEWEKVVKFAGSFQSAKPAAVAPTAKPTPAVAATPRPLATPAPAQPAPEPVTESVTESAPASVAEENTAPAAPSEYVPAPPPSVNTATSSTTSSSLTAPTPRPASSQAPSAWLDLQKKEIGAPSSGTPRPKKNISTDDQ